MKMKKRWVLAVIVGIFGTAAYASRGQMGRDDPCLVSAYSFDNGRYSFDYTYHDGQAGPFTIGQSKAKAATALSHWPSEFIIPMDLSDAESEKFYFTPNSNVSPQLRSILIDADEWTVAIWTETCGYVLYKPVFVGDSLRSIFVHKSIFDGL